MIQVTSFHNNHTFDFGSEFIASYFGHDKKRHVVFEDFSQLLQVGGQESCCVSKIQRMYIVLDCGTQY